MITYLVKNTETQEFRTIDGELNHNGFIHYGDYWITTALCTDNSGYEDELRLGERYSIDTKGMLDGVSHYWMNNELGQQRGYKASRFELISKS